MARPKKTNEQDLLQLVDEYFSKVACGNPQKLKFSLLETYARSAGYQAKAYDFRRSQAVRDRIEELTVQVDKENEDWFLDGAAYKSIDVVALLTSRRKTEDLVRVVEDMDAHWKNVYDAASRLFRENMDLKAKLRQKEQLLSEYQNRIEPITQQFNELQGRYRKLEKENRYLRVSIKQYLYPALANEILLEEQILTESDTKVSEMAKKDMIDGSIPSSTTDAVSADRKTLSKAEHLLGEMWGAVKL